MDDICKRRDTSAAPPPPPRLIIIAVSHFCEKATWALHRYGIHVEVEAYVPGLHGVAVRKAGGKGSTPCLVVTDSEGTVTAVDDSALILKWIQDQKPDLPKLFPPASDLQCDVNDVCARFDKTFGPAVRVWVYAHLLDSDVMSDCMVGEPVPAWQRVLWKYGFLGRIVRGKMRTMMGINVENGNAALQTVRSEFQFVSQLLSDGRPYICGQHFTAADIAFVALALPVLSVPYATTGPVCDASVFTPPPEMAAVTAELRGTTAGAWAVALYARERSVVLQQASQ